MPTKLNYPFRFRLYILSNVLMMLLGINFKTYVQLSIMHKILLLALVCFVVAGMVVLLRSQARSLKVLHAGSLTPFLTEVEGRFEGENPWDVQLEAHGSVEAVRQLTELHRTADVIMVADWHLIPEFLMPEHASWAIGFASNELVLAYTEGSRHAREVSENNWWEILQREDVRWGFSDPNLDPCGYRALMVIKLFEEAENLPRLFANLVGARSNISCGVENGTYVILVPPTERLELGEGLVVCPKSVDLLSKLELGSLDYAFEYKSVAQSMGLRYLTLPEEVNLGDPAFADFYAKVKVRASTGEHVGSPIVYGLTIPREAEDREGAIRFVQFVLGEEGRRLMENFGFRPLYPYLLENEQAIPRELL